MSNFDEALERFHLVDLEYAGGLANHGPMGAHALLALGHQALIPAFVDRYVPRVPPARIGRVLALAEREAARGDMDRAPDWVATFEAALATGSWEAVVVAVVPDLLPGLFAAAGHGLLRTVHAMRALELEDNSVRRRELARGLAHWSARFARLPGEPGARARSAAVGAGAVDPEAALERLPTLAWQLGGGESFTQAVFRLETGAADGSFRAAIDDLPIPAHSEVDAFLAQLCRAAARLYLSRPEARLAYVHAVTNPSAMRWLVRRLAADGARVGAGYAFQAVAALHVLYGGAPIASAVDDEVRQTAETWDEIRYRAACSIEEHAIKLTEACWREDRDRPDPVYRLAAAEAALHLDGSRSALRC